jgi:hypothetical protein
MASGTERRVWRVASAVLLSIAVSVDAHGGSRSFTVRASPFEVPVGAERTVCEYRPSPNAEPLEVGGFEIHASPGLHHASVSAYLGDDRDPRHYTRGIPADATCRDVGPPDLLAPLRSMLLLGSVSVGRQRFPPGLAIRLDARQPLLLNFHYFNGTSRPLRPKVRLRILRARRGAVRHHLEVLGVGNFDIRIPPHATVSHTADWSPPFDVNVAMLSSHAHGRATRVTASVLVGDAAPRRVYESRSWAEPTIAWQAPPLRLTPADRLRFTCEWRNDSDREIGFGATADDEMCFITGYFFRDEDPPPGTELGIGGRGVPLSSDAQDTR